MRVRRKSGKKDHPASRASGAALPQGALHSYFFNDAARLLFQPLNPALFVTHDFTKLLLFFSRFTTQRHILLPFLVLPE
jgi:hypothetical protein